VSPSRKRGHARDDGFTLVEIIVSLGLFAIVSTAVVAQVIVGMRAAATARDISQAKGVAQARLEQMRMMPFFVGRSAGDYIDVLDTYYRHTSPPATTASCATGTGLTEPQTTWSGYLPASAARCSYEPTGAMFRRVINPVQAPGMGAFALVVNTQFITQGSPPSVITPQAGYNSQVSGSDVPAANQIGVTVTVIYKSQSGFKRVSLYSQIGQRTPVAPMIENAVTVSTLRMASTMDSATPTNLRLDVGLINLIGELSTGSKVTANATAGAAGTSLGSSATGASVNASAPENTPALSATAPPAGLFGGCAFACLGTTSASGVSAYSSDGLPLSGTATSPVQATIPGGTSHNGFQFDNGKAGTRLRLSSTDPMVSLDTTQAAPTRMVTDCSFSSSGAPAFLGATGFPTRPRTPAPTMCARAAPRTPARSASCPPTSPPAASSRLTSNVPPSTARSLVMPAAAAPRPRTWTTEPASATGTGPRTPKSLSSRRPTARTRSPRSTSPR
jgi:prepilin-type N-terminal cleavage/methylation domain-containing protein